MSREAEGDSIMKYCAYIEARINIEVDTTLENHDEDKVIQKAKEEFIKQLNEHPEYFIIAWPLYDTSN